MRIDIKDVADEFTLPEDGYSSVIITLKRPDGITYQVTATPDAITRNEANGLIITGAGTAVQKQTKHVRKPGHDA